MKLFVCENPVTFKNPYDGKVYTVPCGKCNTCAKNKSLYWVEKLETERKAHPYCTFITLTYNDAHLPVFFLFGRNTLVDPETGEIVDIDVDTYSSSIDYLREHDYQVCHPCKEHLQRFIKKLRAKTAFYETDDKKKIVRYILVAEYGPLHHRVHYHGILYYDSPWLARNIKKVVTESWSVDNRDSANESLGFVKVEHVQSSAASYTAGYLYCSNDLPKIYSLKPLQPLKLFSKHPPLGSLSFGTEKVREILVNGITRINNYSVRTGSVNLVPLPLPLKNRLFPKIRGFSSFSHHDRVRLYGFVHERQSEIYYFGGFVNYVRNMSSQEINSLGENLYNYLWQMVDIVPDPDELVDISHWFKSPERMRAHRFYSVCNRISYNMCCLGIDTVDEYVTYIEQFYDNCDRQNLADQFEMESQYVDDIRGLLYLDGNFVTQLLNQEYPYNEVTTMILSGYGLDEKFEYDLTHNTQYMDMCSRSLKYKMDNVKTKKRNEYTTVL